MTYEELTAMLKEVNLPFAYDHFAEGESPDPPFFVFLIPSEETFGADNIVYASFPQMTSSIMSRIPTPATTVIWRPRWFRRISRRLFLVM